MFSASKLTWGRRNFGLCLLQSNFDTAPLRVFTAVVSITSGGPLYTCLFGLVFPSDQDRGTSDLSVPAASIPFWAWESGPSLIRLSQERGTREANRRGQFMRKKKLLPGRQAEKRGERERERGFDRSSGAPKREKRMLAWIV